jgi:hypothetical protein
MHRPLVAASLFGFLLVFGHHSFAQRGPAADPIVKEGATVKLAPHSYVIPDGSVGLVPNVGIVVGNRATLVIDPGLGRRNGEIVLREATKLSKNTEISASPPPPSTSTPRSRKKSSPRAARRRSSSSPGSRRWRRSS